MIKKKAASRIRLQFIIVVEATLVYGIASDEVLLQYAVSPFSESNTIPDFSLYTQQKLSYQDYSNLFSVFGYIPLFCHISWVSQILRLPALLPVLPSMHY